MCEKRLFRKLDENFTEINKFNSEYYIVADKIKLKMKLLETKIITGSVYIDRSKNLSSHYYDVIEDLKHSKVIYKKKQKLIMGKQVGVDFEKLMKERKPQGVNTGYVSNASD